MAFGSAFRGSNEVQGLMVCSPVADSKICTSENSAELLTVAKIFQGRVGYLGYNHQQ